MKDRIVAWTRYGLLMLSVVSMTRGVGAVSPDRESQVLPSLSHRFAPGVETDEVPDFQKHVSPLLGRLGCNGRACHGSFQGRGGFQLSLFGYDFKADYKAMLEDSDERVDTESVADSLILAKPTDEDLHEGGKRYDVDSWQYEVLSKWIRSGAQFDSKQIKKLSRLEVVPAEIVFDEDDQNQTLSAIAHWDDGSKENVTEICRFHTNDDAIATIDETGLVTSMGIGDTHVVVSYDNAVAPVPVIKAVSAQTGDDYPNLKARTKVDQLIASKHKKLGIIPSPVCSDAEFLRRVSLDLAGTLPTAVEVDKFLEDRSPNKRAEKVEELLSSSGYAAWWTTRMCDWTGNSRDKLNNASPVRNAPPQQWYEWIYQRIADNVPYDDIVEGIVVAKSRFEGESYNDYCKAMGEACEKNSMDKFADRPGLTYYWARNNFRTTEDRAIGFAYTFLGVRIQCAQCHKHPFDQWSKDDFDGFKNLFQTVALSQKPRGSEDLAQYDAMVAKFETEGLRGNQLRQLLAKELNKGSVIPFPELIERPVRTASKVVRKKGKKPQRVAEAPKAKLLGGDYVQLNEMAREKLMQWLRNPENPYFSKAIVNRVWANYFGVGIVDPVDDLNLANPPSNRALLDYLSKQFIENGYDLQWLHREIVNSDAYQRSWETNETNEMDKTNFSHFLPRRMSAEVLYDSLQIATANDAGSVQLCSSRDGRAVSVASSSARINGRNPEEYALQVFGRSIRESNCDCDRSEEPNLLQTVYMQNDQDVNAKLYDRNGWVSQQMKELGQPMPVVTSAGSREAQKRKAALLKRMEANRKTQQAQLERRKADLEKSIAKLKKQEGVSERQFRGRMAQFEKSLVAIEKRLSTHNGGQKTERNKPREVTENELVNVVSEAYLRTLSRRPSEEELSTSIAYVKDSETVADGVGGLMWALINTKEFLLVH